MGQNLAIKIINYLFYGLFAVSIVLGIIFFAGNGSSEPLLVWTYALSAFAIGSTLVFGFSNVFKSKQSLITSLIVFAIFGLFIIISYAMASDVLLLDAAGEEFEGLTPSISRWSGAALYLLYTLMGISFASLIFTEIRAAFK